MTITTNTSNPNDTDITESTLFCGPFLRLVDHSQATVWFVTTERVSVDITVHADATQATSNIVDVIKDVDVVQLGSRCFVYLVNVKPQQGRWAPQQDYGYQLWFNGVSQNQFCSKLKGFSFCSFKVRDQLSHVIQGSCRKPDHPSTDAFNGIADLLNSDPVERPDYLLMTGDQIYADDVAAPMLVAIQTLATKLGLYTAIDDLQTMTPADLSWTNSMNRRSQMLPKKQGQTRFQKFWHGAEIISARFHDNHLIGLNEFFACYLLTWSSKAWQWVDDEVTDAQSLIAQANQQHFDDDWQHLQGFIETLPDFELTLANVPTLMIFDDHDVTDDWNLSADWESHIYGNDLTRNMIKNALLSYTVFQSWGNNPESNRPLMQSIQRQSLKHDFANNALAEQLFSFEQWHFDVDSQPKVVVLDTRTHRWRSEGDPKNPSGLMDFVRLEELERQVYSQQGSILLVSPAPVFGVKSIEVVQRMCSMVGKELLVDVENWMAHEGSAKKLMNMLRHEKAPDEVIVMSGDVHYSFCFSAERRFSEVDDRIWQLTCSGFKNQFPPGLLKFFDYIDRFLYSPHSLLNVFTKRRRLEIEHHPLKARTSRFKYRNLHTQSAAGLVKLDNQGLLEEFSLITSDNHQLYFDLKET